MSRRALTLPGKFQTESDDWDLDETETSTEQPASSTNFDGKPINANLLADLSESEDEWESATPSNKQPPRDRATEQPPQRPGLHESHFSTSGSGTPPPTNREEESSDSPEENEQLPSSRNIPFDDSDSDGTFPTSGQTDAQRLASSRARSEVLTRNVSRTASSPPSDDGNLSSSDLALIESRRSAEAREGHFSQGPNDPILQGSEELQYGPWTSKHTMAGVHIPIGDAATPGVKIIVDDNDKSVNYLGIPFKASEELTLPAVSITGKTLRIEHPEAGNVGFVDGAGGIIYDWPITVVSPRVTGEFLDEKLRTTTVQYRGDVYKVLALEENGETVSAFKTAGVLITPANVYATNLGTDDSRAKKLQTQIIELEKEAKLAGIESTAALKVYKDETMDALRNLTDLQGVLKNTAAKLKKAEGELETTKRELADVVKNISGRASGGRIQALELATKVKEYITELSEKQRWPIKSSKAIEKLAALQTLVEEDASGATLAEALKRDYLDYSPAGEVASCAFFVRVRSGEFLGTDAYRLLDTPAVKADVMAAATDVLLKDDAVAANALISEVAKRVGEHVPPEKIEPIIQKTNDALLSIKQDIATEKRKLDVLQGELVKADEGITKKRRIFANAKAALATTETQMKEAEARLATAEAALLPQTEELGRYQQEKSAQEEALAAIKKDIDVLASQRAKLTTEHAALNTEVRDLTSVQQELVQRNAAFERDTEVRVEALARINKVVTDNVDKVDPFQITELNLDDATDPASVFLAQLIPARFVQ